MLTVTLNRVGTEKMQVAWADVANIVQNSEGGVSVSINRDNDISTTIYVEDSFANLVEMWEEYLGAIFQAQFPEANV